MASYKTITTRVPEALYIQAKIMAVQSGKSLQELITEALNQIVKTNSN